MPHHHYDLILAGGGLANGLIALRLKRDRPELRMLMLEQDSRPGGVTIQLMRPDRLQLAA